MLNPELFTKENNDKKAKGDLTEKRKTQGEEVENTGYKDDFQVAKPRRA